MPKRQPRRKDLFDRIATKAKVSRWKVEQVMVEHCSAGVTAFEMSRILDAKDSLTVGVVIEKVCRGQDLGVTG